MMEVRKMTTVEKIAVELLRKKHGFKFVSDEGIRRMIDLHQELLIKDIEELEMIAQDKDLQEMSI